MTAATANLSYIDTVIPAISPRQSESNLELRVTAFAKINHITSESIDSCLSMRCNIYDCDSFLPVFGKSKRL